MSIITIDTGIPLPETKDAKRVYPWDEMKVGNSFFVPLNKPDTVEKLLVRVRVSVYNRNGRFMQKYRAAAVKGGVRVWRTA